MKTERSGRWPGGLPVLALVGLAIWLWVSVPLALGQRTLSFRDVFNLHLPLKAFGAEELRQGRIPALNPAWGLGQPFRGNPQALAFYPDNLLYVTLPFWSAFNLHYVLHWLLAAVTLFHLARGLGQSEAASLLAALTYAGSGWLLTCLSFYHLVVVSAWWPLVLLGGLRGGRRGVALGGLACGLALLGGGPLTAALGLVPLLVVAVQQHGPRRGFLEGVAIGGVGIVVALPQVVATLRILPFTLRGSFGVVPSQAGLYSLDPLRLLELLLPLPFGRPSDLGLQHYWAVEVMPRVPLILSLYCGIVGLALAVAAVRRRAVWVVLAAAGWALAWLGGPLGQTLATLSGGLFRYPEKFLFWPALALPLLAGWGLEEVLSEPRRWARAAAGTALGSLGAAVALWLGGEAVVGWLTPHLRPGSLPGTAETQVALWILGLVALGVLLGLSAGLARRRRTVGLVAVQILALLQLRPLIMTEPTAPYRQPPPWLGRLAEGAPVVRATVASPLGQSPPRYRPPDTSVHAQHRILALDLDPTPGVLYGLRYPLAFDADGMFSPLSSWLLYNLPHLDWSAQRTWLRLLGVEGLVTTDAPPRDGLAHLATADRFGVPTHLYRVEASAPSAWWPERLRVVASPAEALAAGSDTAEPLAVAVVPEALVHHPGARVRLLRQQADLIELEVHGEGGVVVVQRAYQELFQARSRERSLRTLPVDLALLGVEIPGGRQQVVVEVSAWPESVGMALSVLGLVLISVLGLRR
jgi:hypothetical protein